MADNPQKRALVNRAMAILCAGRTAQASAIYSSITDAEFADYSTISEANQPDKRLVVSLYEPVLTQCIEEIRPDFAKRYANLGYPYKVNQDSGQWDYLFELPTDFLALIAQVEEDSKVITFPCDPIFFKAYSHVVCGTDDQAWVCSVDHTSADATKPITGATYATKWTLYDTDGSKGAVWYSGVDYKYNATAWLLGSNSLSDRDGEKGYIYYLAYVRTAADGTKGFADDPTYYPHAFKNAFATRLAAEMALDGKDYERRRRLMEEYELVAKPACRAVQQSKVHIPRPKTAFQRRLG